jgi:hypothetical protein
MKFSPLPNINNFGQFHNSSFNDYERNAIVYFFDFDTHKLVFLKRFPGYLLSILFNIDFLLYFTDCNDSNKASYYDLYNIYNSLDFAKILFLVLLGLFIPSFLFFLTIRV